MGGCGPGAPSRCRWGEAPTGRCAGTDRIASRYGPAVLVRTPKLKVMGWVTYLGFLAVTLVVAVGVRWFDPAVVEQLDTTTVVDPSVTASVEPSGTLVLEGGSG